MGYRILSVFVIIMVALGCYKKEMRYNPEEAILTIKNVVANDYYELFLVVENKKSDVLYVKLERGENIVARGVGIVGSEVNLHFVYTDGFSYKINSYYNIAIVR